MVTSEYLVSFDIKTRQCTTIKSFKYLIQSNSDFILDRNKVKYKKEKYTYKMKKENSPNMKYTIFYISFSVDSTTVNFRNMLRDFRKVVSQSNPRNVQLICDGISLEYATILYPKLHLVENSLRKLITRFMLKSLGPDWGESATPKKVKDSIKISNGKKHDNILYDVDFIQLLHFLFTPYAHRGDKDLVDFLTNISKGQYDATLKEKVLDFIPKSNWDRYFSNIVNFEESEFGKKWTELYAIRILVAHNKFIPHSTYEKGIDLCDEISEVLLEAFNKIDEVIVPDEDKEEIRSNYKTNISIKPMQEVITHYANIGNSIVSSLNYNNLINAGSLDTISLVSNTAKSILDNSNSIIYGGINKSLENAASIILEPIYTLGKNTILLDGGIKNPGFTKVENTKNDDLLKF